MAKPRVRYEIGLLLLVLAVGGCASPPRATDNAPLATPSTVLSATPTEPATAPPEPTHTLAPTTTPTLTPPDANDLETRPPNRAIAPTATPTIGLLPPTAPATAVPPIDDTLVFYATIVTVQSAPDQPATTSWAFRSLPPLPQFDPALFDDLYGPWQGEFDFSMFLADRQPQLSPDGQTLLVPGLTAYPQYGVEGTGTWVIDVVTGAARQLLPNGVSATWNPAGDAITYGDGDTLFTLSTAEGAAPQAIFQHPDLWSLYAKWSPDGQWIAALTSSSEGTDRYATGYAATYWLVPAEGGLAHELTTQEAGAIDYCTCDMSWSPDSKYLLVRNRVFDLTGNLLSPDYQGPVQWLPNDARLLMNSQEGLDIISVVGDEIAHISNTYAYAWAFSHDGRWLAYTQGGEEKPQSIAVYDLERGETSVIRSGAGSPLRWSANDSQLILGDYGDGQYRIVAASVEPNGEEHIVLENAELIEVVPYPYRVFPKS